MCCKEVVSHNCDVFHARDSYDGLKDHDIHGYSDVYDCLGDSDIRDVLDSLSEGGAHDVTNVH
jgi:hypothetical protein